MRVNRVKRQKTPLKETIKSKRLLTQYRINSLINQVRDEKGNRMNILIIKNSFCFINIKN